MAQEANKPGIDTRLQYVIADIYFEGQNNVINAKSARPSAPSSTYRSERLAPAYFVDTLAPHYAAHSPRPRELICDGSLDALLRSKC